VDYLEQLKKIVMTTLEAEEDISNLTLNPRGKLIVRLKSKMREVKKEIDVLMDELEKHKKQLIKDGIVSKQAVEESEKEFQN
jgi:hypothetical protein